MRLDKYLADLQIGTRKEVKQLLKQKRVKVNGSIVKDAKFQVEATQDEVTFDEIPLVYQVNFYYEMNKPAGVLSATHDKVDDTVIDLLQPNDFRADLFPIGRLDKNTTGLLVISNDGQLAHRLLSPKHHVAKIYEAEVQGDVSAQDIAIFAEGIELEDFTTQPAQLEILKKETSADQVVSLVRVTIAEGKFHQIKRMFKAVDKLVLTLKRVQMGGLVLDDQLEPGTYRALTVDEIAMLEMKA
ncbi:pseudouridine synthase [Agrilactobacillus fermenti]|uniref:pseudouridine synthase n=1 Tax=Agrilactobacillus fermenti TaxID=2586909 RepID=UPI001E3C169B|nr:pseudouridine synthase [Agrilactobacillus fermenti]MCD2257142.1 rRNA pseudouridine synthase [Agrilactobacillus fermenti]